MNVQRIRGWLLQTPKPAMVRVTGDGEPQELKPGKSYQRLAETIFALDPQLLEAYDSAGTLLRATKTDGADANRSDAAAIPAGLEQDPNALMMTHFANLIHRAYEHSMEVAFVKLVELVERQGDRSDAIEARLERAEAANRRLWNEQLETALEHAEANQANASGGNLLDQMAGAFFSGKASAAAAGKVNGAGKGNGASNGKPAPKGS